ncbi:MAG: VWA domain-containing protein [Vicinamibacteria bacterium]
MTLRTSFVCALLCAVLCGPSQAQTPQKPPIAFGTDLTVIAVPVFVTGKDGKTIPGLTATDFELFDAGKPVSIDSFVAVSSGQQTGSSVEATSSAMRRQFLFLFDLDFSRPINLEKSRRAAKQFILKSLSPGDLVAVATVNPVGFKALLNFTTDRAQAVSAIDGLGLGGAGRQRDPLGLLYDAGLAQDLAGATDQTGGSGRGQEILADELRDQAIQLVGGDRRLYARHVEQFLGGFQSLARTLDTIKGRKQIILFSEGFSSAVLQGAAGLDRAQSSSAVSEGRLWEVDSENHFGSSSGQSAMDGLFTALRGADVVVHTVDVNGLGDSLNLQSQEGDEAPVQGKNSLAEIASNSGGRFIRSANNIESALGEILAATRDFYILAFAPSPTDKGKPRKLTVKVKRPGVSVSHRASYSLPDPKKPEPARAAIESAELIAKGITGGSIKVKAYALPYRAQDGKLALPVVVQIPAEALADAVKRKQIGLQVFGYLLDQHGTVVDFFQATPDLDPLQVGDLVKKSGLQIITTFAAVEGPMELRLLVRDPVGATWGALRQSVDFPAFATGGNTHFASAPLFVDDPFSRLALPTVTKQRPNREIPFRLDNRPITADADPILKRGAAREVCVYVRPASGAAPTVDLALISADGSKHSQKAEKITVVKDTDGFDRVVFFFSPTGVEPGIYALNVGMSGSTSSSPVRIQ